MRTPVPENHDDAITFIQRMVSVGVNPEPTDLAYEADHEERYLLQTK